MDPDGIQIYFHTLYYSKRQMSLPFAIVPPGMRTIFVRYFLGLHAAKIGAGNTIKKNIYDVSYRNGRSRRAVHSSVK